ncbi:hypothetical protein LOD99_2514 [Oopsacas minuta]|uniref:TBC1 domain family member 2B n=1 Tax=Oopsacas minuta TaxID=111878 RepID=A0AAV7K4M4_9METZ|nr:hypothetical protein LOD99_2514 [Oopsacas minuta]
MDGQGQDLPSPFDIPGNSCNIREALTSPVSPTNSSPSPCVEQSWEILHRNRNRSLDIDMIPNFNNMSLMEIESGRSEISIAAKRMSSVVTNRVEKPLCGHLLKMGNNGWIKIRKDRWFKYIPETGRLSYFRSSTDYIPLGSIPISEATFTYNVDQIEKCQFQINTANRTYDLQAKSEQEMMGWLRELQGKRKEFISLENNMLTESVKSTMEDLESQKKELSLIEADKGFKRNRGHSHSSHDFSHTQTYHDNFSGLSSMLKPHVTKSSTIFRNNSNNFPNSGSKKDGSSPWPCDKCQDYQKQINGLKGQNDLLTQQLEDKCQVIKTLQSAMRSLDIQYRSISAAIESSPNAKKKLSNVSEIGTQDFSSILQDLNEEIEILKEEKSACEKENQDLQDQLQTLEEIMQAKENVILSLTKEIYSLEHTDKPPPVDAVLLNHEPTLQERLYESKQQINAYKTNTEFMKKEVDDILSLHKQKEENLNLLRDQFSNLEAEHDKLKGKYLILLKELNKPTACNFLDSELLNNMLKEALNETRTRASTISITDHLNFQEYDPYGFAYFDLEMSAEQKEVLIKAYLKTLHDNKVEESQHNEKWNAYVHRTGRRENFPQTKELKDLIRFGIPQTFRKEVWKSMIKKHIAKTHIDLDESYYKNLLELSQGQTAAIKQVQLDLLRTLPNNKHFRREDSDGIKKLNRVLLAFSYHNPRIGYCQGINRIAAILLLLLDEFDAFLGMVAIIDVIMPQDYYTDKLLDSQADQRVFNDFLSEKIPRLASYLQKESLDISLITFNWFFTVFVDGFPPDLMFRIWDCFLSEGCKILFRYSLAFFKMHEEKLLLFPASAYFKLVKELSESTFDSRRLCHIAFYELNPLATRDVNRKRQMHQADVKQEIKEMDARRESALRAYKERETTVVRMSELENNEEVYNSD